MSNQNPVLNAALEYLDMGFSVIPVKRSDKRPYIPWTEFQSRRATPDEVEGWFTKWPDANVAIITGKISGIFVFDADGPLGAEWCNKNLPLSSVKNITSKGFHLAYLIPSGVTIKNKTRIAPEVDIRGEGGYFVAPPSIHDSGHEYQWEFTLNGWDDLEEYQPPGLDIDLSEVKTPVVNEPTPAGERNNTLTRLVGRWIQRGNDPDEVFDLAIRWNERNPNPLPLDELKTTVDSIHKIDARSNLKSGIHLLAAPDLMAMEFPPIDWIIQDILATGLTLICGKPKSMKSMLVDNWALCMAAGGKALGSIDVKKRHVLLVCLEDGPRRLQDRLGAMMPLSAGTDGSLARAVYPENLLIATEWPKVGEGGILELEKVIRSYPDVMIIIDTLKRIKRLEKGKKQLYDVDYESIAPFKDLSLKHNVSIVVVHHLRKSMAEDPFDMISGSTGLTGATDTNMVLVRQGYKGTLAVQGKDIEEESFALRFNPDILTWNLVGQADEVQKTENQQAVADVFLRAAPDEEVTIGEITEYTGLKRDNIMRTLRKFVSESFIEKVRRGVYVKI